MRRRLSVFLLSLLLLSAAGAKAQFATTGDNPDSLRWMQRKSLDFRILYPTGTEDLALQYEKLLYENRQRVGLSIGMLPGGLQWGRTPVVLHTRYMVSNGSVTWAPKRMDFYTVPDPYRSEPTPWAEQLAIHEQRHLAQMQLGYRGWFKPITWLFGEMFPGALAGVYPGQALLEGDAVVAETGLTDAGRGRTGDFLMYYQLAYDRGDWRNWYLWRYGSLHRYAPDHYALGYQTLAGARVFYYRPLLVKDYFDGVAKKPLRIGHFRKLLKETTGERRFRKAFRAIQNQWQAQWEQQRSARGPFQPMEQISADARFATNYTDGAFLGEDFYSLKRGKVTPSTLVRFDLATGQETAVHSFAVHTSRLAADPVRKRLYWSESVSDIRWNLGGHSIIRFFDSESGKTGDLTRKGRYYNPAPSPDGTQIAVADYSVNGGTRLLLLSADDGSILDCVSAPDSLQLTEFAWTPQGDLYALGLVGGGFVLLKREAAQWTPLISQPIKAKVFGLGVQDGDLLFTSDLNGVEEGYRFALDSGECTRVSNTPYGAANLAWSPSGDSVLFEALTPQGYGLFRSPAADLPMQPADLSQPHLYPVAEALSKQEQALALALKPSSAVPPSRETRFRKFPHLLHIHSWAPVAFDYDTISSGSGDLYRDEVTLGATLLFQNLLGNAYGMVNYSYHKDDVTDAEWRHSAHARFTYSGLYPIFEASIAYNDRARIQYYRRSVDRFGDRSLGNGGFLLDDPSLEGSLSAYVPLSFSKGGWTRGIIPQVNYTISNDIFARDRVDFVYDGKTEDGLSIAKFVGSEHFAGGIPVQTLTLSLRGFTYRPATASQLYPSLGIGGEIGYNARPGLQQFFTPSVYAKLYGYLPGFLPQQGLRISTAFQHQIGKEERTILPENQLNLYPRGFDSAAGRLIGRNYDNAAKVIVEYAIPFEMGHCTFLGPIAYVHHYTLSPHFDYLTVNGGENLFSAGITLAVTLSNFLWAPFDGSMGFDLDYNGGSLFETVSNELYSGDLGRFSAKVSYSMNF